METFQSLINDAVLVAKKAELEFWAKVWNNWKHGYCMPVIVKDDKGKNHIDWWEVFPQKKSECDSLNICLPLLCNQIDTIVETHHCALNKKIKKKWDTAVQADIEMADVTKPGLLIQSFINKGLNAHLKKLNLVPVGKKAIIIQTLSGQNLSKTPQPKASSSKLKPLKPSPNSKLATKANIKVDRKKKGKGKAPVKVNHKGKGMAKS
ncbi:hypothetical protein CVT25_007372 [Psilocybe cyanescens]|uniref:Uncharacterized protein n=1 Tax=Psilocybe cyanescens TaxID=93625 RepID=A0A409XTF7_PSICY|nr:hypothetical protein CVT25_007372 [Psilocybe cyanescens]